MPIGDTVYAYESIGRIEGKTIALSETDMIVKTILGEVDIEENRFELDSLNEDYLRKGISMLNQRGMNCDVILTNVHEIMPFWWYKQFKGVSSKKDTLFGFEGEYDMIPVYWSNSIPDHTTLLVNRSVGDLLIGKELSADIRDIKEVEVKSVL